MEVKASYDIRYRTHEQSDTVNPNINHKSQTLNTSARPNL